MKLNEINQEQLEEGIFTSLKAGLSAAGTMTGNVKNAAVAKAKKVGSKVKEIYKDAKATQELKELISNLQALWEPLYKMEKNSPTLFTRDPEIKQEMELMSQVIKRVIDTCQARLELNPKAADATESESEAETPSGQPPAGGSAAADDPNFNHVIIYTANGHLGRSDDPTTLAVTKVLKKAGLSSKDVAAIFKTFNERGPVAVTDKLNLTADEALDLKNKLEAAGVKECRIIKEPRERAVGNATS